VLFREAEALFMEFFDHSKSLIFLDGGGGVGDANDLIQTHFILPRLH
jgi:hypothetical protein